MTELEARHKLRTVGEHYLGKFGEAVWKTVFRSSGIGYVPLCNIEAGGAPMMYGMNGNVVLPDFAINGDQFRACLDSKCKTGPVLWRRERQLRHGIDRKNYLAYQKYGYIERKNVGLGIVEFFEEFHSTDWSGRIWVESFKNLGEPIPGEYDQKHMVYWPQKRFVNLDTFTAIELIDIANGKSCGSHIGVLTKIFSEPEKQAVLF